MPGPPDRWRPGYQPAAHPPKCWCDGGHGSLVAWSVGRKMKARRLTTGDHRATWAKLRGGRPGQMRLASRRSFHTADLNALFGFPCPDLGTGVVEQLNPGTHEKLKVIEHTEAAVHSHRLLKDTCPGGLHQNDVAP